MRWFAFLLLLAGAAFALEPTYRCPYKLSLGEFSPFGLLGAPIAVNVDADTKSEVLTTCGFDDTTYLIDDTQVKQWNYSEGTARGMAPFDEALEKFRQALSNGSLPVDFKAYVGSSAGDVNNDGTPEIASTFETGEVYLFDSAYHILAGWPKYIGRTPSQPTINGSMIAVSSTAGGFYLWNSSGAELLHQNIWEVSYVHLPAPLFVEGIIVFSSAVGEIHAINTEGKEMAGWPISLDDTYPPFKVRLHQASPVAVDIDQDSTPEILMLNEYTVNVVELNGTIASTVATGADGNTPLVTNLDGDAIPDVVVTSQSGKILVFCKHCIFDESKNANNCNDTMDNDCDGMTDTDPECGGHSDNGAVCTKTADDESYKRSNCNDGIDNDCDGLTDTDPECKDPRSVYLVLSMRQPLVKKYGEEGAKQILAKVDEFAASRTNEKQRVEVVLVDDTESMHKLGLAPPTELPTAILQKTQEVVKALSPRYILIIGGNTIFPFQNDKIPYWDGSWLWGITPKYWSKTILQVKTDDYYADTDNDKWKLPDLPIGRIPDSGVGPANKELEVYLGVLDNLIKKHTASSNRTVLYADTGLETLVKSAFVDQPADQKKFQEWTAPLLDKKYAHIERSPPFYLVSGELSRSLNISNIKKVSESMSNKDTSVYLAEGNDGNAQVIFAGNNTPLGYTGYLMSIDGLAMMKRADSAFFFTHSCYGAKIENRGYRDSIFTSLYLKGLAGFVGTVDICDNMACPTFGSFFIDSWKKEKPLGQSFIDAKKQVANNRKHSWQERQFNLLGVDTTPKFISTIHGFVYYGDPSEVF